MSTQSSISKKSAIANRDGAGAGARKRMTVPAFTARKGGDPLVCLTSYTAHVARLCDEACDLLLVGDSLGMVIHGLPNTLGVTLEHMIMHGQAVVRGAEYALVVVDMPFGSFEESEEVAFRNASRVVKETGCHAVKLEGGSDMAPTIRYLARRGIPVMAHIGLMPQAMNTAGGFRAVRDEARFEAVIEDARAVEAAGAFSVVVEGVAEPLARRITEAVSIPTIGIGASAACDGQILVFEDMVGLMPRVPTFVKRYGTMEEMMRAAIGQYAEEVRERRFPGEEHVYGLVRRTGSRGKFSGARLTMVPDINPRKPGTKGYASMEIVRENPGIVYEDYLARGGRYEDVKWDLDREWVRLD